MGAITKTVAFQGIEAVPIEVQVSVMPGLPSFSIVGLPDKAVAESRERIRAAINAIGINLPPKKITVNLSPANIQKEGSHFDLAISLGLLSALKVLDPEDLDRTFILGELALDSRIIAVNGVLPCALVASSLGYSVICPHANGPEAAWAPDINIVAAPTLLALINHFKGKQTLSRPSPRVEEPSNHNLDLEDVHGQGAAKRALEIAAAGGHNLLMQGPPGSGKSMLAARLAGLLPPLSPQEALEVTMIHSIAGQLDQGQLLKTRPFRDPHHTASLAALVGGGSHAKPGEISLAHQGILFLDELPEFSRATLETLRQPLETGKILISRANAHVSYPANFQLIAAMNPCRCGYLTEPSRACSRAPRCAQAYQDKISGPMLDRIDLHVDVPAIRASDLQNIKRSEPTKEVYKRVDRARQAQRERNHFNKEISCLNSELSSRQIDDNLEIRSEAKNLLNGAIDKLGLSARSYYRILRVAQTIADLDGETCVSQAHVAEALAYRNLSKFNTNKNAA